MKNIWAPWRVDYILKSEDTGCIFCNAPKIDDPLILKRGDSCFSIMNRYPYTTGHCIIAPYRHIGDMEKLNKDESIEMLSMIKELVSAIKTTMKPQGFNVGCNIGSVAGAGVKQHIHIHIVPRWEGDTNFMPVLADVHMISEHIRETRDKIKGALS
ncbi:MAG: HIT domain-containing protein [Deltaproteobacteria bacterium]|nr:HIT domain-containing protein [Deltaproteobacteria bacterium]